MASACAVATHATSVSNTADFLRANSSALSGGGGDGDDDDDGCLVYGDRSGESAPCHKRLPQVFVTCRTPHPRVPPSEDHVQDMCRPSKETCRLRR